MRLQGFLGLLVLLAVLILGPGLSESRTVSKHELKVMIHKKLQLPKRLLKYKAKVINIIVCEVDQRTQLRTDLINVLGTRVPMKTKPMTTTTLATTMTTTTTTTLATTTTTTTTTTPRPNTTTATAPPPLEDATEPTDLDTAGSESVELGSRRRRDLTVMDDEGSGMSMTMEDVLNMEEDKFDEEMMMRDDNTLDSDSSEEDSNGVCTFQSTQWSLGYYGIFGLSDSHFCCSGYRWSRNLCKKPCNAFTDDDISDDVDCLVKSGFWRFLLRMASGKCLLQYSTL